MPSELPRLLRRALEYRVIDVKGKTSAGTEFSFFVQAWGFLVVLAIIALVVVL